MRAVVQRVTRGRVSVGAEVTGEIGHGLVVLLGVGRKDGEGDAEYLASKVAGLRIFADESGKMNRSVAETGGSILAVSQFTLYGDVTKGRRPAFDAAAPAEQARKLYEHFIAKAASLGVSCQSGRFQENMQVELINDGPVTILLDSEKIF